MRSFLSVVLLAVTAFASPLEPTRVTPTENAVSRTINTSNMACKPIIMIYGRGTWEPPNPPREGQIPTQVAKPLLATLEQKYPGKIDFRNVVYDGGAGGYLSGGDRTGTNKFGQITTAAARECPNSKLLLVGYSQGSQILNNAVKSLPADVKSHIKAIFMIGDPNWSSHSKSVFRPAQPIPNNAKANEEAAKDRRFGVGLPNTTPIFQGISNEIIIIHCDYADNVCNGAPLPVGIHDNYTSRVLGGNMAAQIATVLGPA